MRHPVGGSPLDSVEVLDANEPSRDVQSVISAMANSNKKAKTAALDTALDKVPRSRLVGCRTVSRLAVFGSPNSTADGCTG